MTTMQTVMLAIGLLLLSLMVALLTFVWVRQRSRRLQRRMLENCRAADERIVLGPQAALYRGADRGVSNNKGNGVMCLTEKRLIFERLTGPRIVVDRTELKDASLARGFKGETALGTGNQQHLLVHTKDGKRIGFLINQPQRWHDAIKRVVVK